MRKDLERLLWDSEAGPETVQLDDGVSVTYHDGDFWTVRRNGEVLVTSDMYEAIVQCLRETGVKF